MKANYNARVILANVKFGKCGTHKRADLEELIESYLAALLHNGQIYGGYYFAWTNGVLNAFTRLACPSAFAVKYHSKWGRKELKKIIATFQAQPSWVVLDDYAAKKTPAWRGASFLYLFTHALDGAPILSRGEDGSAAPICTLPITDQEKQRLSTWQARYSWFDNIWLGGGSFEIPAYRELADPKSELSQLGRDLCSSVERATGIATYYYLMRYWGRMGGEADRKCPGCGSDWKTNLISENKNPFWQFHFRCDRCRLVSHHGVSFDDETHVHIGEYQIKKN